MPPTESEIMSQVELYQRVVVQPVVDVLKAHVTDLLQPIAQEQALQAQRVAAMEPRIDRLESVQWKIVGAFFGGVIVAFTASLGSGLFDWFRHLFH